MRWILVAILTLTGCRGQVVVISREELELMTQVQLNEAQREDKWRMYHQGKHDAYSQLIKEFCK